MNKIQNIENLHITIIKLKKKEVKKAGLKFFKLFPSVPEY